jgi:SAM-dependent methyltransferase
MNAPDRTRERIAKDYTTAITQGGGCCGGASSGSTVAALAGYGGAEIADLPGELLASSFGCGNPLAFSEVKPGETVLDLGSGAGLDLIIAARKVGPSGRVIGVDMTDAMLAAARANIAAAGPSNIELRRGIIEALPVADAAVDWVISNCVINLSPEKEKVFAEIARVLRPGGRVQVSDIVAENLPQALRENAALVSACVGGAISEADYCAGLRAAGLVDVEVPERLVYEASQLEDMVGDVGESGESKSAAGGCGTPDSGLAKRLAGAVAGKIWSAQFRARKPE